MNNQNIFTQYLLKDSNTNLYIPLYKNQEGNFYSDSYLKDKIDGDLISTPVNVEKFLHKKTYVNEQILEIPLGQIASIMASRNSEIILPMLVLGHYDKQKIFMPGSNKEYNVNEFKIYSYIEDQKKIDLNLSGLNKAREKILYQTKQFAKEIISLAQKQKNNLFPDDIVQSLILINTGIYNEDKYIIKNVKKDIQKYFEKHLNRELDENFKELDDKFVQGLAILSAEGFICQINDLEFSFENAIDETDSIYLNIAKKHLNIKTLKTQNSDRLDFHDISVWDLEKALKEAWKEGYKKSENNYGDVSSSFINERITEIAKSYLNVSTLKERNSDDKDFSNQAIWSLHKSLKQSYNDGLNYSPTATMKL